MVKLYDKGAYLVNGTKIVEEEAQAEALTGKKVCKDEARKGTIAYGIMEAHNTSGNMENLKIKFDAMASHDITFVGIIQTAKRRNGKISNSICPDKLPQLPVCSRVEQLMKMTTCLVCPLQRNMAESMYLHTLLLSISICVRCMRDAVR